MDKDKMLRKCPKCGSWVTGQPQYSEMLDNTLKTAVSSLVPYGGFVNMSGATNMASHYMQDKAKGTVKFLFECGCGHSWTEEVNVQDINVPDEVVHKLRKQRRIEALKRNINSSSSDLRSAEKQLIGLPILLCVSAVGLYFASKYCYVNDLITHDMVHDSWFGDMQISNWHFLWILVLLTAIIALFLVISSISAIFKCIQTIRQTKKDLRRYKNDLAELQSGLSD